MLFKPTIFFYRRLIFTSSTIIFRQNILALILIQIGLIHFQLIVLHSLRIFESRAALWKQTQDEFTYLLLIYVLICFTDLVPDPEQRNNLGVAYICIMFTNIGLHMIPLIWSTISSAGRSLKRCYVRRHLNKCCCCGKKKTKPIASA